MTADPGATPVAARALAPDLARGGMLLLIALANVHLYGYGPLGRTATRPGHRGGPAGRAAADVPGRRAGVPAVRTAVRIRDRAADPAAGAVGCRPAVTRLVRRRGGWMIVIGLLHGVLLWSGDIVGAYGLLAVLMAGLLVRGSDRAAGHRDRGRRHGHAALRRVGLAGAGGMRRCCPRCWSPNRSRRWPPGRSSGSRSACCPGGRGVRGRGARRVGRPAPAARRAGAAPPAAAPGGGGRDPAAALGGLPLALIARSCGPRRRRRCRWWPAPCTRSAGTPAGWATRRCSGCSPSGSPARGPGPWRVRCRPAGNGRCPATSPSRWPSWRCCRRGRSASGSTPGCGSSLIGFGAWLVILLVAALSDRAGYRGPAETLLRRLTYGRRRGAVSVEVPGNAGHRA